jgi:lambda family phage tail tape measure protein
VADYSANIRIGVTGLDQLNKTTDAVVKLSKLVQKRYQVAIDPNNDSANKLDKIGVALNRVNALANKARSNLNKIDVNNWAELRGAVKRVVDTLELQKGVQQKINKELDLEIAKRNQLKTAVQSNIAASRQGREASNYGLGNAGDPVAKSIRRQEERQARLRERALAGDPRQYAEPAFPGRPGSPQEAAGTFRAGISKLEERDKLNRELLEQGAVKELENIEKVATAGIAADNKVYANINALDDAYWKKRLANAERARKAEELGARRDATRVELDRSGRGRRRELDRTGGLSFDERLARRRPDIADAQGIATARSAASKRFQGIINSAAIGGGFPLLFGQGAGASAGGLLGGGLGGALGGAGGFAGGIVGSLIGTQFDKLKASAIGLADALKAPSEALAAMEASGIKVGSALKNTVDALEATGRAAEAQALVFAELEKLGGTDYVQNLLELEEANKALQDQWSLLSVAVQKELLPWFIEFTNAAVVLAGVLKEAAPLLKVIGPALEAVFTAANPFGLLSLIKNGAGVVAGPGGVKKDDNKVRQPQPVDDTRQRKALDEAIARQKEVLDLQRRGEDLARAGEDFRRDQEEQIYNLRKKAADYDREVAKFRRDIEEKIFDKQQENARTLAELTRQRRQNVIEQLDQSLEPAGQISALQGGGRAASVDLAREYIRTLAEGQADLQEKEAKSKLDIAKVQRDADKFSLDVADKVKDFSDKAADYAKEVEKFKYETAKKVVDLQRQAADYTYAQWERVYKLAATAAEKSAAAADQGISEPASNFTSNASRGQALIGIGKRLGISPLDLALVIQAESGGNPSIVGGAGGNYQGLIQFGPSERRQYGYRRGMGFEEQLGPGGPVENYLKDRFRGAGRSTQGASLLDLYTTVLAGNPGANPDARDSFGNSARSQVAKIQRERESVRQRYFTTSGPLTTAPVAAATPVSFPSAASVAGPVPKAPSALPLTGVPSSLARPDVSKLLDQYKGLNAESVKYLQDLQETAREAAKLSEIAAKTKLDRGNAELSQQFLQPLLDANQALEDRAAYEREYGDLLQNGALPALAEQLATADRLEKTQLRLLELEQAATQEAIKQTKAQLARTDITVEQRKEQEKILAILQGQAAVLDQTRGTIIQQSDQQRGQIQAAESPEARRQRTLNEYNKRKNEREDTNRPFDQYMKAKADLEDLIDPLNQVMSATDALGNAFGDAFQSIISGSESADQALKKMFANIGSYFLNMAMQILAQQAMTSILKMISGGVGAAAGGGIAQTGGSVFSYGGSFAGGGYTGDGSRSGGIDGQGGFPAILHPQETVIDHTMAAPLRPSGQMMGGGDMATPEINYSGAVLNFNSTEYVMKKDVPRIIAAGTAATGSKMRNSVAFRKRTGI